LRVGIVGAGYIAPYHVAAIDRQASAELVAVCDMSELAAQRLASGRSGVAVYTDLATMLAEAELDVVHVLTQPDSHYALTRMVLEAGCHAIVEKPVTASSADAVALESLAKEKGLSIGVNHNFVFSRPFLKLKGMLAAGELGPLKSVRVVWKKPLPPINFGPWNLWMLREPDNILFETGSHTISELLAICPDPTIVSVDPQLRKVLPSGVAFYRRWNIRARAGAVAIQVDTAFDMGYEQHFVEVEGMFGVARADIENDVLVVDQPTGRAYDIERFRVNFRQGKSRIMQAYATYASYALSKLFKSATGTPYETSMQNGIASCYEQLTPSGSRSRESSIGYAIEIARLAESIQAKLPALPEIAASDKPSLATTVEEPQIQARVLIIGASGFIGRHLLIALQERGDRVRALVRNASNLVGVKLGDNCEVLVGDYRDQTVMEKALGGVEVVFHLAVAHSNSLKGYIQSDVEPTKRLVDMCRERKIKRFVYTGTIDSVYLGPGAGLVKEADGIDRRIERRNNYAHSKAMSERYLNDLHKSEGFPVVIVRPAIVLGAGGPVDHLGIAEWFGLGHCAFWGKGENTLPIVLVDDVVRGLISAMDAKGIEGKTYNLSARPCLTARDYVAEVESVLGSSIRSGPSSAFRRYLGDMMKWVVKLVARHPDASRIPSVRDWKCRQQHATFDTSQAEQDLGFKPQNDRAVIVEQGIREPTRLFLES
jgi:nucleoside-diphosphate-sugar epimerase